LISVGEGIGPLAGTPELRRVVDHFHRINRIIPEAQVVLELPPEMKAREAVALLNQRGYSQAPATLNGEVVGAFSHRSFARKAAEWTLEKKNEGVPGDLPVEECLERLDYVRVTDELKKVFDFLDRDDAVLIGGPQHLQGILSPMDFVRYLHRIASP